MVEFDIIYQEKPPKGWNVEEETCEDCDLEWLEMEYYMVHNHIWKNYGVGKGHLCFSCLEHRMKRNLNQYDFTDAPINKIVIRIFQYFEKKCKKSIINQSALK